jgi:uncharacterized membrane protein YfcA
MVDFENIFKWALWAFLWFSGFGVVLIFLINTYKYFRFGKEKRKLRIILLLAFVGIVLGFLLTHFFGKHTLYKELVLAVILFLLMLVNLTKWNPLRKD